MRVFGARGVTRLEMGRFLRANLSSGIATALDWALVTAIVWLGVHYLIAAGVGAIAGALTDFAIKRHWAFDRSAKGTVTVEGLRYLLVSASSLCWNLLLSWALVGGLGAPAIPGVIAASILIGVLWNYPLHRWFVFRGVRRLAVVCDFDGTATLDDLADELSIAHIGRERWQRANDRFHEGKISFEQLLREMFEPIAASREEFRAFAMERVRFRPGFERLISVCRERGVPFVLASGGLDNYVLPALEKLPPDAARWVDVRANHGEPIPGGLRLVFPNQHAPGACGTCGSCKGAIVQELKANGHVVVAVGDGNADRCMARVSDVLFARGRLRDWCGRNGIPFTMFEGLDGVADLVESWGAPGPHRQDDDSSRALRRT